MKEYQTLHIVDGRLLDNGTLFNTLEQLQLDFPVSDGWLVVDPDDLPSDFSTDTYTISDGQLVRASEEVIAQRQAAATASYNEAEIAELRAYLTSTDYTAIKCGELGLSMVEAYPDIHAQRTAARARINELEKTTKL